jgi:hypothetical protein
MLTPVVNGVVNTRRNKEVRLSCTEMTLYRLGFMSYRGLLG